MINIKTETTLKAPKDAIMASSLPHASYVRIAYETAKLIVHEMDDAGQYAMRLTGAWLENYHVSNLDIYEAGVQALLGAGIYNPDIGETQILNAPEAAQAACNAAMAAALEDEARSRAIRTVECVQTAVGVAVIDAAFSAGGKTPLPMALARQASLKVSTKIVEIIKRIIKESSPANAGRH